MSDTRAPEGDYTTNLYVVLLVTRTHQAVVYEIPTAAAPENEIANRSKLRVSGGLGCVINLVACIDLGNPQVSAEVFRTPVLNNDRKDGQDGD